MLVLLKASLTGMEYPCIYISHHMITGQLCRGSIFRAKLPRLFFTADPGELAEMEENTPLGNDSDFELHEMVCAY